MSYWSAVLSRTLPDGVVQDRMKLKKDALASYESFLMLSNSSNPDQEFQARQRVQLLKRELKR